MINNLPFNLNLKNTFLSAFAFFSISTISNADVTMPYLFSSNMVLQRDTDVNVWGTADAGEEVTVDFAGQNNKTSAGKDGRWSLKLKAMPANKTPQDMTVSGKNKIELKNILIGDIWVCSGQSNMDYGAGDIINEENTMIRLIDVERDVAASPKDNLQKTAWTTCTRRGIRKFSAVGYYFAKELTDKTGIPVGLIGASWGATRIEGWIPAEGYRKFPELKSLLEISLSPELAPSIKAEEQPKAGEAIPDTNGKPVKTDEAIPDTDGKAVKADNITKYRQTPSRIFNGMIAPLTKFSIKGVIWYQGESNADKPQNSLDYPIKMQALIDGWRECWKQNLSFYYVQLANKGLKPTEKPEGGDLWAKIRDAQLKSLAVPNTGMAVAIDIGEANIHPKNKFDVGKRLAAWALAKDYKMEGIIPSGPIYKSFNVEKDKIRISFDYADDGLMIAKKTGREPAVADETTSLKYFSIAGDDKKWYWADAVIDGSTVLVSSKDVKNPVAVRYAFAINPAGPNLYNKAGLPASPFRTDDWELK